MNGRAGFFLLPHFQSKLSKVREVFSMEPTQDKLLVKARARRRRALTTVARSAKGVVMTTERSRPPRLTAAAAQKFMTTAQ